MKKFTKLFVGAVASLAMVPAASAGTFTPTPGSTAYSLDVEVRKLLTLNCELTAEISSNGTITGDKTTTGTQVDSIGLAAGDSNCSNVAFTSVNMPVTYVDANTIRIHDIYVAGITGDCSGYLDADVLAGGILSFRHTNSIPRVTGIGNCSVQSDDVLNPVTTTPAVSYTYP